MTIRPGGGAGGSGGSSVAPTQVSVHVPVNTADSASNAAVNAYAWQPLNPDLVAMTDGFTLLTDASPLAGHETEPNVLQVDVAGTYAWVMTFGVNLRTLDNPMDGFLGRNMPGGDLLANQVVPIPQLVTSKPNQIMSGIWLVQAGEQIQFGFGPDGDPVTTTADLSIDLHLVRIGDLPDFL